MSRVPKTCWVCAPGGKAHVALSAAEARKKIELTERANLDWIVFPMPNGGEAHFRLDDITAINTDVIPRIDARNHHTERTAA